MNDEPEGRLTQRKVRHLTAGDLRLATEGKCPECGHPTNGPCKGDFIPKYDAYYYVTEDPAPREAC